MTETPGFNHAGDPDRAVRELHEAHTRITAIFAETAAKLADVASSALAAVEGLPIDSVLVDEVDQASLAAAGYLEPCSSCHGTGMVIDVFADVDPDPCLECEGAGAFDVYGRPTSCR